MTAGGSHSGDTGDPERQPKQPREPRESDGWQIFSYMIAGMVLYGAIGWQVGRWTGLQFLFPVGMITGLASGIALIIFRVTRS
jgi:ATP synthase protein I